ncbi:type I-E CRISPR-associated protein Cas5/CasD [Nocardia sp. NPDC050406]|uniref:type I-E CRISPR-associated protein Cas5/CasD n=1 Tax=Nocardia sp. NPDC050406 TaxID=3364318 RepID=UPI0037A39594
MSGLLLHLSGPLQSWGTRSHWNFRDTLIYPTRSGLVGLVAAAMGHPRHEPLTRYTSLEFTIRIDRPGQVLVDYHTVGGGRPREQTPARAGGGHRAEGAGTIVSHRHYLTDAAFTVAITSPDEELITDIESALSAPTFGPHLGRRSCPPAGPLVLGRVDDPATDLCRSVPIARERPRDTDSVLVEIVAENPRGTDEAARSHTNTTQPISFGESRAYHPHTTWHTRHSMPAALCSGIGSTYLDALIDFQATAS